MSLDCNTPQGQVYIQAQLDCIEKLALTWNCSAFPTKTDDSADVDVIFIKNGHVALVGEVKSRELSLAELERFGSYLITHEKLLKVKNVAISLCVPSVVVVSLLKDKQIVYWRLTDSKGNFEVTFEEKVTETKKTCNGGKIFRNNAYISLDGMQILK
jgi:hypothetical protein